MLKTLPLIVLFGSYARNNSTADSDIDVCVIGDLPSNFLSLVTSEVHATAKVSVVVYTPEKFECDYRRGKLFLHHILSEGVLLAGNSEEWRALRNQFIVQADFDDDIKHELSIALLLGQTELFGGKHLHALSHGYLTLKNAAIFVLACRGIYDYRKEESIHRVFAQTIPTDIMALLQKAHRFTHSEFAHDAQSVDGPRAEYALRSIYSLIQGVMDVHR